MTGDELNRITEAIIAAAIFVHREPGPGLLESTYKSCLAFELRERGHFVEGEKPLPVLFKGQLMDGGFRIDLMVDGAVVVELKAVNRFDPIHAAQTLNHLKLSGSKVGLLINFNVQVLVDGVKRFVSGFPE